MGIKITFPGGKKINTELEGFTVPFDLQESEGGEGTAPNPLDYFLMSIGACAGLYALSFCQQRDISTEGLELNQQMEYLVDEAGKSRLSKLFIDITLPPGFPEKYHVAIVKAVNLCTVKKVIFSPPEFVVKVHAS
jgi:ribosomal protein S12 methylthiotransferase accessory factor